jgi:CRP-like cAMP-binding protein
MNYTSVLANVSKHITLEKVEVDYFTSLIHPKEISRKDFILKEGDLCDTINYVQSGVLRAYYRDKESNDNIIMFALNDWWITDMYSFVSQQPAMLHIDAIEDSIIIQLRKEDLERLYIEVPKFEKFFRIIMQNSYVREQLRVIQNLSLPAEERYLNFLTKYPQIVQRVPLKQIASYLGITPEFLSVIRKKISKQ